tara:strand:+ start:2460 stop:3224 length:765 start_codon:yes stop_codon:yes gene_type:complete
MAFKMKGSTHYGKGNTSPAKAYGKPSPAKDYSVDKGSHNHPHGDSPNKFLGGMMKKLGGAAKGMLKGKDGKFGIGDVGRLAMGPLGAAAGATGLFMKENPSEGHSNMHKKQIKDEADALNAKRRALIKNKKTNKKSPVKKDKTAEKNQFGETPAEYKKRMVEMGLRSPDKKKENPSQGHSNKNSKAIKDEANALNAKRRKMIKDKKSPTKIIGTIKKGVKKVSDKYKAYEKKKARESMARAANASAEKAQAKNR